MIITGSALFVEPGTDQDVLRGLAGIPEVTFHVASDSRSELVITIEAQDQEDLERVCFSMKEKIPEIIEVAHLYVNFEEEIAKIKQSKKDDKVYPVR